MASLTNGLATGGSSRRLARAVVVWAGLMCASPAAAQPAAGGGEAKAQAEVKVVEARLQYEKGDYQAALATLQAAFALYPSPKLHFNIGVVQRGLGRDVEALVSFERFLAEAPDATAERRAAADRQVAELRGRVAFIDVVSDVAGAEVFVDGRSYGNTPLGAPLPVVPGPHQVLVQKTGAPLAYTDRLEARAGALVRVQVRLAGATEAMVAQPGSARPASRVESTVQTDDRRPAPTPTEDRSAARLRIVSIGVGALGVAGLVTGAVLSWRVSVVNGELRRDAQKPTQDLAEHQAKVETGRRLSNLQWPAYVAGGVLLAGGLTGYLVSSLWERDRATAGVTIAPMIAAGGTGAILGLRF